MDPDVQQKEANGNQHEAVGGIFRSRPAADLARASVARFDAEAAAVSAARLAGRPVQVDENEDHPFGMPFQPFGALGRGEHPAHRQLNREARLVGAVEGVSRPTPALPSGACNFCSLGTGRGCRRPCPGSCRRFQPAAPGAPTPASARSPQNPYPRTTVSREFTFSGLFADLGQS